MGKKGGDEKGREGKGDAEEKEGRNLLGAPTFVKLENGRYKCKETGHELPHHARESYARSKHCRLGLIDAALSRSKPPLNMFQQDPQSRSKLICKLTGDTVNKTEEHIWKHINGKRFLSMLDKKEAEENMQNGDVEQSELPSEETMKKKEKKKKEEEVKNNEEKKKKKKKKKKDSARSISEARITSDEEQDGEEEDFWMPPVGERWDHDDGGPRNGSRSDALDSGQKGDDSVEDANGDGARELSKRTKRMSIEIGPSSFASRKKKKKIKST